MLHCYVAAASIRVFEVTGENDLSNLYRLNPNITTELDNLEKELAEKSKVWEAACIDDYILKIEDEYFSPFCGKHVFTIRDSRVVETASASEYPGQDIESYKNNTIPGLFKTTQSHINKIRKQTETWLNADKHLREKIVRGEVLDRPLYSNITVTFNEQYGYPSHIAVHRNAEDADYAVTVKNLSVLTLNGPKLVSAKMENKRLIMSELERLNIEVVGKPEQTKIQLPTNLSGPNWGLKEIVCKQGGYDLSSCAGKELLFTSLPINEIYIFQNIKAPLSACVLTCEDKIACVFKADRGKGRDLLVPGIFSVKESPFIKKIK